MSFAAGARLGPFEILGPLGAGGMGEVYRARDTKLNRVVAIKVLPDQVANDHDRLNRFSREAQLLAALNHPNIAQIHGLEDAEPTTAGPTASRAIVMELVEGPTLAERIAEGAIPIEEALPIARQIAEALESAHEQGISPTGSPRCRCGPREVASPMTHRSRCWTAATCRRATAGRTTCRQMASGS
jgi:serine/threonine protein kinase